MTPRALAEKIARDFVVGWSEDKQKYADMELLSERIAAALDQMAIEHHGKFCLAKDVKEAKAAYKDAANEVRSFMHENGMSVVLLDLAYRIECRAEEVAK